jgi:hypothetical protein
MQKITLNPYFMPRIKMNSKGTINPGVRAKAIQFLEENTWGWG